MQPTPTFTGIGDVVTIDAFRWPDRGNTALELVAEHLITVRSDLAVLLTLAPTRIVGYVRSTRPFTVRVADGVVTRFQTALVRVPEPEFLARVALVQKCRLLFFRHNWHLDDRCYYMQDWFLVFDDLDDLDCDDAIENRVLQQSRCRGPSVRRPHHTLHYQAKDSF